MSSLLLHVHVAYRIQVAALRDRWSDEVGEGVISTAIAVLIMALLGAAMWVAFRAIFDGASNKAGSAVDSIGG
ncbi:MAG TPA: hypothetical protein VM307_09425 [Egibacteraceae bacterium]|nr:hypothetical protein [Egibacteraceae bacterium]